MLKWITVPITTVSETRRWKQFWGFNFRTPRRCLCVWLCFLGATKHLYNWLCPLVGWLVGRSVGRSVGWYMTWHGHNDFVYFIIRLRKSTAPWKSSSTSGSSEYSQRHSGYSKHDSHERDEFGVRRQRNSSKCQWNSSKSPDWPEIGFWRRAKCPYRLRWFHIHDTKCNKAELSWVELSWAELNWAELSWVVLNWAELS